MHRHNQNIRRAAPHFPGKTRLRPPKRKGLFDDFIIFKFGKSQLGIELVLVIYQKSVFAILKAEIFEKILDIYSCTVNPGMVQISGIDSNVHKIILTK
jgi:hypothetical protein